MRDKCYVFNDRSNALENVICCYRRVGDKCDLSCCMHNNIDMFRIVYMTK